MPKWKVTLPDKTTETVDASSHYSDGVRLIFYDRERWGKRQYEEGEWKDYEEIEE